MSENGAISFFPLMVAFALDSSHLTKTKSQCKRIGVPRTMNVGACTSSTLPAGA